MRTTDTGPLEQLQDALAGLTRVDPCSGSDESVRSALPALLTALHQLAAVVSGVVGVFDARDLAPGLPEPARLDWFGDIPAAIAQRIACDVWRCVLDPNTGMPLEVGRTHRIVPHWIRKALHARDQGCRFPGCTAPVAWTDAHHWKAWYDGGQTTIDNLLSLCRYHHVIVHEGRWTLTWDHTTGAVYAFRPDGTPYELGPSLPHISPTRRRGDPPPRAAQFLTPL